MSSVLRIHTRAVTIAAVAIQLALSGSAWAGASTPSRGVPQSSVDLRNATPDQLRTHVLDTCVIQQWNVTTSQTDEYASRCGCYASRIVKAMTPDELSSFRTSGVFNETTRPKAQEARAACKL